MSSHFWWYLSRAAGIVSYLMLSASVLWGVFLSTKILQKRKQPAWLLDLHRWLAALTIIFLVVHLGAILADSFVTFTVQDLLVPFHSSWFQKSSSNGTFGWFGRNSVLFGVISLYFLVIVQVSSLLMKRIPRPKWHAIHLLSYVTFWLTTIRGVFAGTDATNKIFVWSALANVALIAFVMMYRGFTYDRDRAQSRARQANLRRRSRV